MATDRPDAANDWSQSQTEIFVKVPVGADVGKDRVKVKFETSRLSIWISGNSILATELSAKVVPDDCYWALEGSGGDRALVVTLGKKKDGEWRTLTKDEEDTLPECGVLDDNFDVMQLEHDDDDPERVEEQLENEKKLEARYKKLIAEKGLEHEDTLRTFFALFDNCIQLYRLNKLSDYLEEVVPACRKRTDNYKLKALQALAFVRWKQSRFRESLVLFHEMEECLGKGAALCENIAHTYNSLGDFEKAEDYFRQALKFIEGEHGANRGNRGGVLLGLGIVRDRLGKHKEALPVCIKAYEFYKDRANGAPASLQAKAGISCAKLHMKLNNYLAAEALIKEAVEMYEVTCGETSPLTASAYFELGKCFWAQRKRNDAQNALKRAYELEAMKDAWELVPLLEIHNLLMDTHLKETDRIERSKFDQYYKTVDYICGRVRKELPQDGNAAVYFKAAGELKAWGACYTEAKALFDEAIPLFMKEKSTDCTGLISSCTEMIAFCERNLAGTQNCPMEIDVPEKAQERCEAPMVVDSEEVGTGSNGVIIEELDETIGDGGSGLAQPGDDAAPRRPCEYRQAMGSDFSAFANLCVATGYEPQIADEAAFHAHIGGAGCGLCWAAFRGGRLVAFALCGSDGICGRIFQLIVLDEDGENASDATRRALLMRISDVARQRGLRRLVATTPAGSADDAALGRVGGDWSVGEERVHTLSLERGQSSAHSFGVAGAAPVGGSGGPAGEASAKGSGSTANGSLPKTTPPQMRRDGTDTGQYYDAWNKVNVEKALLEEDGEDPTLVPEAKPAPDDFGVGVLDVTTKLMKYAWDQSDKFVTIYVQVPGAAALPAEDIEVVFRPRGFLLVVNIEGKKRWLKMPNLCKNIDTAASTKKVKTDDVVVKLRKLEVGLQWSDLTDEKDEYQKRREFRINHGDLKGATTEQLLADMYKNATDEERDGLRDAMRVNREKRQEENSLKGKK